MKHEDDSFEMINEIDQILENTQITKVNSRTVVDIIKMVA